MINTYVSVCSGIEAASLALQPLGLSPVAVSEIDKTACAFLTHKHPTVPNVGDMLALSEDDWREHPANLLIGGTPCQEFSQMGRWRVKKEASATTEAVPRARLAYRFVDVADWIGAECFIWENSPNVLSVRDGVFFQKWLAEVSARGFVVGWRVLDTFADFGLPARRTRLYAVGHRVGSGAVEKIARALLFGNYHSGDALSNGAKGTSTTDRPESGAGRFLPVGFNVSSIKPAGSYDALPTLIAGHAGKYGYVTRQGVVRKLVANEAERAMGFPIGYTNCIGLSDNARSFLIGNSFSPVVIGAIAKELIR